jgi:hypothetical protein
MAPTLHGHKKPGESAFDALSGRRFPEPGGAHLQ